MSWRDPDWKYTNAANSSKPGYLKRKFAQVKVEQKKEREARLEKIFHLPVAKKA